MTAEENENNENKDDDEDTINNQNSQQISQEILNIFEFLSDNKKIIFKSQQIDDQELQRNEKIQIARELYEKNRQTFLMRFGCYFEEQHLSSFAHYAISDGSAPLKTDENDDEMQMMLHDFQRKLQSRQRDIKNRRYTVMQQLIEKGEYFSEQEMMRRAPELYQELIGQYLSEMEKKERDSYDVKNTTFSGILMHTFEQKQMSEVLKEADKTNKKCTLKEITESDDESQSSSSNGKCVVNKNLKTDDTVSNTSISSLSMDLDSEVPISCRQQWGNFENETINCSTSKKTKVELKLSKPQSLNTKLVNKFITSGERELLRQEFISIMHEKFLSGDDKDFDYDSVDNNSQLDDLKTISQDEEDAYFEDSDDDDDNEINDSRQVDQRTIIVDEEESEDELDIYMTHLNRHHTLQNTK